MEFEYLLSRRAVDCPPIVLKRNSKYFIINLNPSYVVRQVFLNSLKCSAIIRLWQIR